MEDPARGRLELHEGEVAVIPPVKALHTLLEQVLQQMLGAVLAPPYVVCVELPFRASENDCRIADVGALDRSRLLAAAANDEYVVGAPDVVVEVLSPGQDASDLFDKERVCLGSGCRAFWVVDPKNRQVRVSTPDRRAVIYTSGDSVPMLVAPGEITVHSIFEALPK
jgi:Uma2 family endonuclease